MALFIEDDGEYSVADILVASDDHFASTAAENIRREGVAYLKSHKDQYTTSIQVCLKDRVKAQNTDLLTYALTILAPCFHAYKHLGVRLLCSLLIYICEKRGRRCSKVL